MSKRALSVATLMLLAWAAPVEAQCRKRILLYVDLSQSMGQPAGPSSPYEQARAAAAELLRQRGLIGPDDRLLVFGFGEGIPGGAIEVRGSDDASSRLARLPPPDKRVTDLGAALDHMAATLAQPSSADREVVVIASDFAHDPTNSADGGARTRDWAAKASARLATWRQVFTAGTTDQAPRAVLALLRAPLYGAGRQANADQMAREAVLDTLSGLAAATLDVDRNGSNPADIARQLAKLFYVPPKVTALLTAPRQFTVVAANRGCMAVTLKDAVIECDPKNSDGPRQAFPASQRQLQGAGAGPQERSVAVDVSGLECPSGYVAKVETEEAAVAEGKATGASRFEFEPIRGILGPQVLADDVLELRVRAWGAISQPQEFSARLALGSAEGPKLAEGKLLPPRELAPLQGDARIYRIVVRVDSQYRRLIEQDGVALSIDGSASEPKRAAVENDPGTWFAGLLSMPVSWVVVAGVWWARLRRQAGDSGALFDATERVNAVMGAAPTAVLIVWSLLSGTTYAWTPAWLGQWRDAFGVVLVGCSAAMAIWWMLRQRAEDRLRRQLADGRAIAASSAEYRRRVSFRGRTLACLGLALAAVVGAVVIHNLSPRRGDAAVGDIPFVAR